MIKNIIFDLGGVVVRWTPSEVWKTIFPQLDYEEFYQKMRPIWFDVNLGKLTIKDAIALYHEQLNLPIEPLNQLFEAYKEHQKLLPGSLELLKKLQKLDVNLYSITDNVKEFIAYHKIHSEFLPYFKDVIISCEVGVLKPDNRIYQYLLDKHKLKPEESVFIDDLIRNVEGAKSVGMESFQFINAEDCTQKLIELGVQIS